RAPSMPPVAVAMVAQRLIRSPVFVAMQSLDGLDLAGREAAAARFGKPAQLDGSVGDAMQPLDLEPEGLRQAAHDAMAPFGERQLDFHGAGPAPNAKLRDPDGAPLDHDGPREGGVHRARVQPMGSEPVAA